MYGGDGARCVRTGEGRYPACYEAKVGLDGAQLPVATFSVRARPALKTGCASFSLDLAAAGMASLPIHTGNPIYLTRSQHLYITRCLLS